MTAWWCAAGTWEAKRPPSGYDIYVTKTLTLAAREPHAPAVNRPLPDGGHLNTIGVRNPGVVRGLRNLPAVPGERAVSILGFSMREWSQLASYVEEPVLELNLSCPNTDVPHVGNDPNLTERAINAVRGTYHGHLGAKLPPCVSVDVARACQAAGADYLCLVNTLPTPLGALSGRPLRALALETIDRVARRVSIPIVGGGGIREFGDGQPYLDAGATDLFIGTANLALHDGQRSTTTLAARHTGPPLGSSPL